MKYIVKKLSEDFIFDELEQVRKQFVDALTYTMESANIAFDKKASDPLDIYIEYDFQQKHGEEVVYGFNLGEEIAKSFEFDRDSSHSSKQLISIARGLRELADDIESRYDAEPSKTLADKKDRKDKKDAEYAKSINRSYREILRDAMAMDEALQKEQLKKSKKFLNAEYKLKTSEDEVLALKENERD